MFRSHDYPSEIYRTARHLVKPGRVIALEERVDKLERRVDALARKMPKWLSFLTRNT